MRLDPLHLHALQVAYGRDAASHVFEQVADTCRPLQLVDGRAFDVAGDGHHRANGRDEDGVTRLHPEVALPIAPQQEIVEVQGGYGTVIPDELNVAQRAQLRRPTRGK